MTISSLTLPDISQLEVEEGKQVLRSAIRAHRKQRGRKMLHTYSQQWVDTVLRFVGDRTIVACYVSVNQEPPTREVIDALCRAGKRVLLPKLGPGLTRAWGFYGLGDELVELAPGRPPEPASAALQSNVLDTVEALVIPALAVSWRGARLGQGGGWYDRALKQVSPDALIGAMVYPEEYISENIPQDEMDVSIPYVIHPTRIEMTAAADESCPQFD
ncbi:5-formyltetrahydrofolate cyclo-ligase [Trueperella bialowiezensis]|uniref:5-formyltetrahydrofolate cyclo-ligase n=1 Tax=Trueperella bialowiezensis TaxID=312285 RepID=A0A3S4VT11_9ACTO|nr:5-formyltetrahydrofolate cyclo-ligase [Trueperella bialowiezensis]VEI13079.1 5-formyltetrahydrofolate cyclo-ligase family protein [Trueperella bialowiezensis]